MGSAHDNREDAQPAPAGPWAALRRRLDRWVARSPDVPYLAPFMAFLLLMALGSIFAGPQHLPWLYAVRTFGALAVALVFWKYWPALGKAHVLPALLFGLATAAMWVLVHKWFAAQSWYPSTQLVARDAPPEKFYDCYAQLGTGVGLWLFLIVRIGGASLVVPIIEEIFWRGWVLRVLVNYWDFQKVALGTFTLRSFVLCTLASALEHPMWEVGILCWAVWNLFFYWKKSLLFMIVVHGVTNFALYAYVVVARDWVFWS